MLQSCSVVTASVPPVNKSISDFYDTDGHLTYCKRSHLRRAKEKSAVFILFLFK